MGGIACLSSWLSEFDTSQNLTTREVQFYLSSLPGDALRIGQAIRQHWGIENQLHWVLDVTNGYGCIPYSQRSWS